MSECLVVARDVLERLEWWQRLERKDNELYAALRLGASEVTELLEVIRLNGKFMERNGSEGVEDRPEWQQIIFYGILQQGDRFLVYRRGGQESAYAEKRLASKLAIGVGGHIEPFDQDLLSSLYRELDEELCLTVDAKEVKYEGGIAILGVLKYDTDAVGRVHLGLACLVPLDNPRTEVGLKGDENVSCEMTTLGNYYDMIAAGEVEPETWTILAVRHFLRPLLIQT